MFRDSTGRHLTTAVLQFCPDHVTAADGWFGCHIYRYFFPVDSDTDTGVVGKYPLDLKWKLEDKSEILLLKPSNVFWIIVKVDALGV